MIRRVLLALAVIAVPQAVYAQFPSQNISLPTFVIPASAVNGGGTLSTTCLTWPLGTPLCEDAANVLAQRNSTNAQRFNVANTYTSSTNNELFSVDWQTTANTALVGTRTAATGTTRAAVFESQTSNGADQYVSVRLSNGASPIRMGFFTAAGALVNHTAFTTLVSLGESTNTATSGTFVNTAVLPTYNQASGTAANTDLLINRTPTAVGSGTQLLFDAQNNSVSKFSVSNTGLQTTTQTTIGNAVQSLQSTATNDDPIETVSQGRVTTTDATLTTVQTITIPTDFTVTISCIVTARRTGGAAGAANDGAAYRVDVVMKNTAGTAAEIAAETTTPIGESQAGFNASAAPSGATELIQVTGVASNNMTWHSTCRTYQVNQ